VLISAAYETLSSNLQSALESLAETPPLDTYLAECLEAPPNASHPAILLLHPRFREDEPDVDALVEFLWLQAVNYVVPLRLRRRAKEDAAASNSGGDLSSSVRLLQRAKRAFIEFNKIFPHRASEVGELLAYLIALRHLGAVQICSKMALKTNSNMPIHGLDGVHAKFSDGIMTLYFLESKLAKTAKSGSEDYAESTAGFGNNRKQYLLEYEIVSDLSNLSALSEADQESALDYLDVYGKKKSSRLERSVGVICFTDDALYAEKLPKDDGTTPLQHESALSARLTKRYASIRTELLSSLLKHSVDAASCRLFYVAVPNVDKLREKFYEVMDGN
jgi:hypothetical protein